MISVVKGDSEETQLHVPEQPGGLAVSDGVLAVVTAAAREMAFYDTNSFGQTAVLPGGAGPSHVVAGDDGRFYVADTGGDAILVYEGGDHPRLLDRTNVSGSPYGLAIDNSSGELWVTRTGLNEVSQLQNNRPRSEDRRQLPDRPTAQQRRRRRPLRKGRRRQPQGWRRADLRSERRRGSGMSKARQARGARRGDGGLPPAARPADAERRPLPPRLLHQPPARPLAHLVPRLGDAAALDRRGADRLPLPRGLQPEPRLQRP